MSKGPFLNIKIPKELLARLDDYRFATRKPSRAEAARELVDRAIDHVLRGIRARAGSPGGPGLCPRARPPP